MSAYLFSIGSIDTNATSLIANYADLSRDRDSTI